MIMNEGDFNRESGSESDYNIDHKEFLSFASPGEDHKGSIDSRNNFIHPLAHVSSSVKLGRNNYIGPFCYIVGNTTIGDNNHFEAYCSIGTFPEYREYFNKKICMGVTIGNRNVFREFTTVNAGTGRNTQLRNEIWMLRGSHVGHDAIIEQKCTLSCNVIIGGHSHVMQGANMGMGSVCHQQTIIAPYVMIGMNATVTKKTCMEPFYVFVGSPAKALKKNDYAIERHCISEHGQKFLTLEYLRVKKEYQDTNQ